MSVKPELTAPDLPDAAILAALRRASTATLTTQLFKRGFRNVFIQGVQALARPAPVMVGPAFTLRFIPSREDVDRMELLADPLYPQRRAIEVTPAGHVLVMDCRGDTRVACAGQILVSRLAKRGVAGLVAEGGMRDAAPIAAMEFPVFCAGPSAPLNLVAHHAAECNVPIGCGGVAVYPGDLMVGDGDGVVVIPRAIAAEVAADAAAQEELEEFVLARIEGGAPLPGTYPPDATTRALYDEWRATRNPV